VGRRKGDGDNCAVGGITIAPNEAASDHFDMPAAALDLGGADVMMSPQKIAQALHQLAESTV
jgi:chemotaxis response regulator CheB